jgi:predicted permease
LNETLKESSRGSTGGRHRVRSILVVAEVAVSMVLLIGAGLLVRSFVRLLDVNPGFNPANITTMQLSLPRSKYKDSAQVANFYNQALEQIRALPGVQAAGTADNLPLSNNSSTASFAVEGLQVAQGEPSPHGDNHSVSADYFTTMAIPLRAGRFFTDQDTKDALPVAIIDESLAAQYYPDGNAVGKRLAAFYESKPNEPKWRTIVGVVGTVKQYGLEGKRKKVQYYFPITQSPQRNMYLVVRNGAGNSTIVPAVRAAIQRVDKDQPIFRVSTMEQMVADSVAERRLVMYLLAVFAGVALLLATVGIYGVMSYSVTQRTHEIGIRMALGAQTSDVLKMVVRQGMAITLVGVGLGIVSTIALTSLIASLIADLLFGVGAKDPLTFVVISAILVGVALGACLIPARRATRVDPMIALRHE